MLLSVLILALPTIGFAVWARSLRRRTGRSWLRVVPWLLGVGLVETVVAFPILVLRAFRAIEHADASQKATILAEALSNAMTPVAVHLGLLLVALVVLAVVELRARGRR